MVTKNHLESFLIFTKKIDKQYVNTKPTFRSDLLFGLFVHCVRSTSLAKLLEFKSFFDCFLILVTSIPDCFALCALELDNVVLGHSGGMLTYYSF